MTDEERNYYYKLLKKMDALNKVFKELEKYKDKLKKANDLESLELKVKIENLTYDYANIYEEYKKLNEESLMLKEMSGK